MSEENPLRQDIKALSLFLGFLFLISFGCGFGRDFGRTVGNWENTIQSDRMAVAEQNAIRYLSVRGEFIFYLTRNSKFMFYADGSGSGEYTLSQVRCRKSSGEDSRFLACTVHLPGDPTTRPIPFVDSNDPCRERGFTECVTHYAYPPRVEQLQCRDTSYGYPLCKPSTYDGKEQE